MALAIMLMLGATAQAKKNTNNTTPKTDTPELKTEKDSLSYAMGLNTGIVYRKNLQDFPGGKVDVDNDILIAAFAAGLRGDTTKYEMDKHQASNIMQMHMLKQVKKRKAREEEDYRKKKPANDKYISDKLKDPGYVELPDAASAEDRGTLLKINKKGEGRNVKESDFVCMTYTSRLTDGTIFDESKDSSAVFPLDGVITGLGDALKMLNKGSKATVIVPSELGYGKEAANNGTIPANSVLIFDIELIYIFETEDEAMKYMETLPVDESEEYEDYD